MKTFILGLVAIGALVIMTVYEKPEELKSSATIACPLGSTYVLARPTQSIITIRCEEV